MQTITDSQKAATARYIESMPSTTEALFALGEWLLEMGDDVGASKLTAFAFEFEKHEATTR